MDSRPAAAVGVSFVVAGPGDPELLTVRAHRLLKTADVVLADAEVVDLATHLSPGEVLVALDSNGIPLSLAARTKVVSDARKAGKVVARLLSGDPVLDGRIAMETEAIAKAGLIFEVVAGTFKQFNQTISMPRIHDLIGIGIAQVCGHADVATENKDISTFFIGQC